MSLRLQAIRELQWLVYHARATGESLRSMISIPPVLREALEEFCVLYPSIAPEIREVLDLRDLMLDYVNRMTEEELWARFQTPTKTALCSRAASRAVTSSGNALDAERG